MGGLNVVALISGGKDSLFSILHCQANGHKVLALANLHPPHHDTSTVEDLESYMYQTVGHAVIPLYEHALGLPLYRQEILGTAVNQDKNYGLQQTDHVPDETESLLPLLRKVLDAHPEVNALSTGAILSDYQRTRVESVALRLGLTPLAYLWQYPFLPPQLPSSLLSDMATVGQDSRIVKVASGGLDDSFLWQNVADHRTIVRLSKATDRFGSAGDGAVLGEGGEYETLAISGPAPLWKGRIVVEPEDVKTVPGDAGSASVRIHNPTVVPLHVSPSQEARIPTLLDAPFADILNKLSMPEASSEEQRTSLKPESLNTDGDGVIFLSNLTGQGSTAAEQTRFIMETAKARLDSASHKIHDIAYTIIILRDMAEFGAINAVYGSYFTKPNPPARVTIACAAVLPDDALVSISITSVVGPREGLHVQSRSYWAPANIGPYSQAIKFMPMSSTSQHQASIYIAGQIPLVPASMELPQQPPPGTDENFTHQSVLALQHLERIGRVMKVVQWTFGIAFIATPDGDTTDAARYAQLVRRAWKALHEPAENEHLADIESGDSEDFDVWHLSQAGHNPWRIRSEGTAEPRKTLKTQAPPLVVIRADSLPRGATVEWVGYGRSVESYDIPQIPPHLHSLLHAFRSRIVA